MKKRCLTLLLILAMCLTMLPVTAMAVSADKTIRLLDGIITKGELYVAFGGSPTLGATEDFRYAVSGTENWYQINDSENTSTATAENLQDGIVYNLQNRATFLHRWRDKGTFTFQTYYKIGVSVVGDIPDGGQVLINDAAVSSSAYEVNKGEELNLTFTSVNDYDVQVKVGNGAWNTVSGTTYSYTPSSSTTLSVRYASSDSLHTLTVNVNNSKLGTYTCSESGVVTAGTQITLTATPYNSSTTDKDNDQYAYVQSVKVNSTELTGPSVSYTNTVFTGTFEVTENTTVDITFAPRLVLKAPAEGPHVKHEADGEINMYSAKMDMDKQVSEQVPAIEASILDSTVDFDRSAVEADDITIELKAVLAGNDVYHEMNYSSLFVSHWGNQSFHNDGEEWEEIRLVIPESDDGKYPAVTTEDLTVWILEARPELTIGGKTDKVTVTSAYTMEDEIEAAVLAKILADNTGATAAKLGTIDYDYTAPAYGTLKNSTENVEVSVTVAQNDNYLESTGTITVPVALADASCTAPTANNLTYNGKPQALVAAGTPTGGTMQYKLDDGDWSEDIPTAANAGTYKVYYKVVGDDDHNDFTPAAPINVTIAAKGISEAEITLASTSLPYTGAEQSVTITSVTVDGLTVTYDVTGNTGTDARDYTLTLTGTGNFTGTATADWVITKTALTVTAANKAIYIGQRPPEYSFTLSGLLDGHTASGITVQCPTAQLFRVGMYPITIDLTALSITDGDGNDVTANYAAEAVSGTLTVKHWPSSGSSSTTPEPEETPSEDIHDCPSLDYSDLNPDLWYHKAVDYVLDNELMNGVGGNRFDPYGTTSRAMIVTILWRLEGSPKAVSAPTFTDVPDGMWYTEAIRWAASSGIVKGYGDQTFGLNDPITREQLATILYRYEQYKHGAAGELALLPDFADRTEVSDWAYEAMCWAVENGVIKGRESGLLDPKGRAMRCETAQMLMNDLAE